MKFVTILVICLGYILNISSGCSSDEFTCFNGQCIKKLSWCDGRINCKDKTDELFCKTNPVKSDPNNCEPNLSLFKCDDGRCIPTEGVCDGLTTCTDASDEKNCDNFVESYIPSREQRNAKVSKINIDDSALFVPIDYREFRSHLESARTWLLSQRHENYGWGDKTSRAVIALYLSKTERNLKTEEEMLIDNQLGIHVSIALNRNETACLSNSELALNINALTSACKDPRNFFGYDLVTILRERVDGSLINGKFVSPYVLLTLCINNVTNFEDIKFLQNAVGSINMENKIDILALAVLASTCIIKLPEYSHPQFRRTFISRLLDTIQVVGLPGNIYEMALLVQALNEAKVNPNSWNRKEAIEFILKKQDETGSFGDILATYYTMPILSGRSFLSLSDHCSNALSHDVPSLNAMKDTRKQKINVIYSLHIGYPVEMTQRIILNVAAGTNFLDIMKLAQEINPNFRFSLDDSKSIPFVYSIGGIPNDAERGLYWTLSLLNSTSYFYYNKDIRHHIPRDGEETVFSLMPI